MYYREKEWANSTILKYVLSHAFQKIFFKQITKGQYFSLLSMLSHFFLPKNNDIITNQFVTAVDSQLLLKNTSKSKVANRAHVAI